MVRVSLCEYAVYSLFVMTLFSSPSYTTMPRNRARTPSLGCTRLRPHSTLASVISSDPFSFFISTLSFDVFSPNMLTPVCYGVSLSIIPISPSEEALQCCSTGVSVTFNADLVMKTIRHIRSFLSSALPRSTP
jgi:hypothetical protein